MSRSSQDCFASLRLFVCTSLAHCSLFGESSLKRKICATPEKQAQASVQKRSKRSHSAQLGVRRVGVLGAHPIALDTCWTPKPQESPAGSLRVSIGIWDDQYQNHCPKAYQPPKAISMFVPGTVLREVLPFSGSLLWLEGSL